MSFILLTIGLNNCMQRRLSHQAATPFEIILSSEMITYRNRSAHSYNVKQITCIFYTLHKDMSS